MDEIVADLAGRGFPIVRVNFPRSYVDVNREPHELDPRMFAGRLPSFANTRSMRVAGGWEPSRGWSAMDRKSTASDSTSKRRSRGLKRSTSRITVRCDA